MLWKTYFQLNIWSITHWIATFRSNNHFFRIYMKTKKRRALLEVKTWFDHSKLRTIYSRFNWFCSRNTCILVSKIISNYNFCKLTILIGFSDSIWYGRFYPIFEFILDISHDSFIDPTLWILLFSYRFVFYIGLQKIECCTYRHIYKHSEFLVD